MNKKFIGLSFAVLFSVVCSHVYASGGFDAKSWESVDVAKYNKIIISAHDNKREWVTKPEFYVHYLLGLNETKEILYSIEANRMEMPTEFTIKLKRKGLLDDSVSGDIHVLVMKKTGKGYWKVVSGKRASSCWRSKSKGFQSKPCP